MNIMIDDKLEQLKRMVPDGKWNSDERTITRSDGAVVNCSADELSDVDLKITLDFLVTLANSLSRLENDWQWARDNVETYKRDLEYFRGKADYWKRRGYDQALKEIIEYLTSKVYTSISVRDAFQELVDYIEETREAITTNVKIEDEELSQLDK